MKKISFLQIAVVLALAITFVSCGLTQPGYGDEQYPDRQVRSRQIYSDPYYNSGTTIVRDPYTGRYYEVTPVSPYGYDAYSSYGSYGNNPYYGRRTSRGYSNSSPRRSQTTTETQQQNTNSETINRAKSIIRRDR